MHITDIIKHNKPSFSFEFFPPKTEQSWEALYTTIMELGSLRPDFVSVTYGAGGGTRESTHKLVSRIQKKSHIPTIPHLTCVGHSEEEIHEILEQYAALGVHNILALRGDPPRNQPNYDWSDADFTFAADLVRFVKKFNDSGRHPHPKGFGIGVAGFPEGHPATPNRLKEMDYLKEKVDAGADYICTQLFFDNHDFFDFRERCELAGIHVPIIAGIMPILTLSGMKRMAELSAGSRFPAKLLGPILTRQDSPEDIRKFGVEYAIAQCAELLENQISGIHFYTLNRSDATREIYTQLNLSNYSNQNL